MGEPGIERTAIIDGGQAPKRFIFAVELFLSCTLIVRKFHRYKVSFWDRRIINTLENGDRFGLQEQATSHKEQCVVTNPTAVRVQGAAQSVWPQ